MEDAGSTATGSDAFAAPDAEAASAAAAVCSAPVVTAVAALLGTVLLMC